MKNVNFALKGPKEVLHVELAGDVASLKHWLGPGPMCFIFSKCFRSVATRPWIYHESCLWKCRYSENDIIKLKTWKQQLTSFSLFSFLCKYLVYLFTFNWEGLGSHLLLEVNFLVAEREEKIEHKNITTLSLVVIKHLMSLPGYTN